MRLFVHAIGVAVMGLSLAAGSVGCGSDNNAGGAGASSAGGAAGSGGSSSAGGSGGQAGTGGSGGTTTTAGDCVPGDASFSCPEGETCQAVVPGGFDMCARTPTPATTCTGSDLDQCCSSSNCTTGECFRQPVVKTDACSGDPNVLDNNVCIADQCTQDADCGSQGRLCAQRGAFGNAVRACVVAACRTNADCQASPGGICAPVNDPCCDNIAGLFCVYPDDGCRSSSDCSNGSYCNPDQATGAARCTSGTPECLR